MKYCADCGTGHECEAQSTGQSDAVEIARIEAKRDVEVARLTAGMERDANETEAEVAAIEAEAGVEAAEATADALTGILTPPEPEPAPAPEIVVAPEPEPEPEPAGEVMPPPVKGEHSGYGNPAFFGGR